ncbi:GNAT family N-acetyltransferase [Montanilutibacter psychrotolerans]|uniref:GNAT family N-acetyltransferase n=1 Tax=Montanilutibacter psychrotolerans TaxID=1327343 RepID=A0A3M8SRW7_9GAMM|nr:GNAT family N-acetyltransferase [Lysobacter psychrotolerans]RNF82226.1 GNAT family N-acetyltransferase [Lysobacter psychrotolerans]
MHFIERLDAAKHDIEGFACGEHSLDRYLKAHAAKNQLDGIATTHVLVESFEAGPEPGRRFVVEPSNVMSLDDPLLPIVGYFALSAAQLQLTDLQPKDRARLPRYPVPAVRMGRMAVATSQQGKGFGDYLIGEVVQRALDMRTTLGVRVLTVDALPSAVGFYTAYGFRRIAPDSLTLYLPLGVL